ncbi:UNVERIFIED_CONTAM: hypothetical protein Sindi_2131400 [Sesamum indicum]
MGSKWRKVKLALGLNLCVYGPNNHVVDNDDDEDSLPPSERRSDAALLSPPGDWTSAPPTPTSNKLKLSKSLRILCLIVAWCLLPLIADADKKGILVEMRLFGPLRGWVSMYGFCNT